MRMDFITKKQDLVHLIHLILSNKKKKTEDSRNRYRQTPQLWNKIAETLFRHSSVFYSLGEFGT
jgi:hypothetical protein